MQRLALKEKELHYIHALETNKLEQQTKIHLLELEQGAAFSTTARSNFDVSKNICLVPPFNEKDVDKYFVLFEHVATTLKWPEKCVDVVVAMCFEW